MADPVTIHEAYKSKSRGAYQFEVVADEITHNYEPLFGKPVALAIVKVMRRLVETSGQVPSKKAMKRHRGRFELMYKNTGKLLRGLSVMLVPGEWEIRAPLGRFDLSVPEKVRDRIMNGWWKIVDLKKIMASPEFLEAQAEALRKSIVIKRRQKP